MEQNSVTNIQANTVHCNMYAEQTVLSHSAVLLVVSVRSDLSMPSSTLRLRMALRGDRAPGDGSTSPGAEPFTCGGSGRGGGIGFSLPCNTTKPLSLRQIRGGLEEEKLQNIKSDETKQESQVRTWRPLASVCNASAYAYPWTQHMYVNKHCICDSRRKQWSYVPLQTQM